MPRQSKLASVKLAQEDYELLVRLTSTLNLTTSEVLRRGLRCLARQLVAYKVARLGPDGGEYKGKYLRIYTPSSWKAD